MNPAIIQPVSLAELVWLLETGLYFMLCYMYVIDTEHVLLLFQIPGTRAIAIILCIPLVVFRVYDKDRDGRISKEDLSAVSCATGGQLHPILETWLNTTTLYMWSSAGREWGKGVILLVSQVVLFSISGTNSIPQFNPSDLNPVHLIYVQCVYVCVCVCVCVPV